MAEGCGWVPATRRHPEPSTSGGGSPNRSNRARRLAAPRVGHAAQPRGRRRRRANRGCEDPQNLVEVAMKREQGFTLVELLVSTGMAICITAAILAALQPAEGVFSVASEAADMQQRLRVATNALYKDLAIAGAGTGGGCRTSELRAPANHALSTLAGRWRRPRHVPKRRDHAGVHAIESSNHDRQPDACAFWHRPLEQWVRLPAGRWRLRFQRRTNGSDLRRGRVVESVSGSTTSGDSCWIYSPRRAEFRRSTRLAATSSKPSCGPIS